MAATTTTQLREWLDDFDNKQEEIRAYLRDELGFQIDNLPLTCLPIEEMVQNYTEGKVKEDQLTPAGLEKYKTLHPDKEETTIDVFDFKTYFKDFLLFTRFYCGLELYLRVAIWLNYKYEYIVEDGERDTLDQELEQRKNKKEYLDSLTDTFEPKTFVEKWYQHFNPNKIQPGFIDYVMNKPQYLAHPDYLFNQLYRKYVEREWDLLTILWFSQRVEETPPPKAATTPKLTPRTTTTKLTPKVTTITPTPKNYTALALRKLTCPQLKEILKQENAYKGCSKLTKDALITKILSL